MSDLIDRQAAIDALKVRVTIGRANGKSVALKIANDYADIVKKRIEALPSARPEIIRCKDCKYAHLTVSGECKYCDAWTDDDGYPMEIYEDGDFFCGNAERRSDE